MDIKELKSISDNYVPPREFGSFFKEWKKDQERQGFNWSDTSYKLFRDAMITGMILSDTFRSSGKEVPVKRTRNNRQSTDTIKSSSRTRTRTRNSD